MNSVIRPARAFLYIPLTSRASQISIFALQEISRKSPFSTSAGASLIRAIGRDERGQYDCARFHKQFGHLADSADIFFTVRNREPQVATEPVADVVAAQDETPATTLMQAVFYRMDERRFTRSGQSCEPEDRAAMAVFRLAMRTDHSSRVSECVGRSRRCDGGMARNLAHWVSGHPWVLSFHQVSKLPAAFWLPTIHIVHRPSFDMKYRWPKNIVGMSN